MKFQSNSSNISEARFDESDSANPYPWISHPVTVVFIITSAIGNLLIFTLVCVSKTFRRPSNYLVANLCVASVFFMGGFCFYNIRSGANIQLLEYSPLVCSVIGVLQRWSTPLLPYTITAISVDRSKAARNPLDHTTNGNIFVQIVAIWSFGFILMIPRTVINQYDPESSGMYKCKKVLLGGSITLQTIYAVVILTFVYLLPTYILIKEFLTLWSKMRFLTLSQMEQKKRIKHRLRLMQNSCIFTIIFITCWLPQGIFQFPFDLPREVTQIVGFQGSQTTARDISRQIVMLNTCLNPVLLLLLSFDMREFLSTCSL